MICELHGKYEAQNGLRAPQGANPESNEGCLLKNETLDSSIPETANTSALTEPILQEVSGEATPDTEQAAEPMDIDTEEHELQSGTIPHIINNLEESDTVHVQMPSQLQQQLVLQPAEGLRAHWKIL